MPVVAEFASARTITPLSREHLDLVAMELDVAELLEAPGGGARRRAGAIVRADALAMMSLESAGGGFVRLV